MKVSIRHIILFSAIIQLSVGVVAQESIFNGLQSDIKKADNYYQIGAYADAIELYQRLTLKRIYRKEIVLKLANAYYQINDNRKFIMMSKH